MALYKIGSMGQEVVQIQTALKTQGLYLGPLDGIYGGGTASAVRAFQSKDKLTVDGVVGIETWTELMGPATALPIPSLAGKPIASRCVALTGAFETNAPPPECYAGVSGDFDGMGISFGVLQWNLGQSTLQSLLRDVDARDSSCLSTVFGERASELRSMLSSPLQSQLSWARSIQTQKCQLVEPWLGLFKTLGRTSACIDAQDHAASEMIQRSRTVCFSLGLISQRALALTFDILAQDGGIDAQVMSKIMTGYTDLPAQMSSDDLEVAKMTIAANCRADAASVEWRDDVRTRKLTIAQGGGVVHGRRYDLSGDYGITLAADPGT